MPCRFAKRSKPIRRPAYCCTRGTPASTARHPPTICVTSRQVHGANLLISMLCGAGTRLALFFLCNQKSSHCWPPRDVSRPPCWFAVAMASLPSNESMLESLLRPGSPLATRARPQSVWRHRKSRRPDRPFSNPRRRIQLPPLAAPFFYSRIPNSPSRNAYSMAISR